MSVSSILVGTPAGVIAAAADFAVYAGAAANVNNALGPVLISQSAAGAGNDMNIVCNGGGGLSIVSQVDIQLQTNTSGINLINNPGSGGTIDFIADAGYNVQSRSGDIVFTNTAAGGGSIDLNADVNIDLEATNGNIDLSSPAGRVQLASNNVDITGNNLNITSANVGLFGIAAVPQQDGNVVAAGLQAPGGPANTVFADTKFGAAGDATKQYDIGQIVAALQAYGILK
jgi:hypothetical protein